MISPRHKYLCILLLISPITLISGTKSRHFSQLTPFSLNSVRLTESPFYDAMKLDETWLLKLEPDRLLSGFRSEAGLKPKAPKYGGWESGGVAGQTFGHYLSACAMMYASTGEEIFNDKIKYCIEELDTCQKSMGNGLVAGFPRAKELFAEVARGDIRTKGFDINGSWVPLYTVHKLLAGLVDVYNYTSNKKAYKILTGAADYLNTVFSGLSDEQIQKILVSEQGGISEAFANIYGLTGDNKYLNLSLRLNHKAVLEPLSIEHDELKGKHANTQIPKIIGVIRQFDFLHNQKLYKTADFFWNTVVVNHSYVIGGNSEAEHFGIPGKNYDRITNETCETCNTYNMLKLTKDLFRYDMSVKKVDFYERALYNQILGSQNPKDGMVCYFSPLSAGSSKIFSTPYDSFWCCVGTGFENHARYGEFIYFKNTKNDLYINLFIPSVLSWKERGILVEQTTRFPESDTISYQIKTDKQQKFTIHLRYPAWAVKGYKLLVNGKEQKQVKTQRNESYIKLRRTWSDGDRISYILPMSVNSEPALGDSTIRAYMYGPIVLSAILPPDRQIDPVVITENLVNPDIAVSSTPENTYSYKINNSEPYKMEMIPYYKSVDKPVMVYFNHFTPGQWKEKKNEFIEKKDYERWLKEHTISDFTPGEMQPERDHNLQGINMEQPGELNGRKYRKAIDGGEFSFNMDVLPDKPMDLQCTFWGNLGDIYKFDILVDDTSIATVIIHWWGNQFFDKTYRIPESATKGKREVRVTFKAIDNKSVSGPLFNCKTVLR